MKLQKIIMMMKKRRKFHIKFLISQVHLVIIRFQTLGINLKDKQSPNSEMQRQEKVDQQKWSHIERESTTIKMELLIRSFLQ